MILLIDVGNTRVKWAALTEHLAPASAAPHQNWTRDDICRHVLDPLEKPTRVLIANVAGDALGALFADALQAHWSIAPEFIHSTREIAGVRNGYENPAQLGVDRWLTAIAAYRLERRAVCVANVGTALTVDCVDARGRHLGGIIVPGPELMMEALYRDTREIAKRAQAHAQGVPKSPHPAGVFATNTREAVNQGIAHALAAVVERARADLEARSGAQAALLVGGGAASRIAAALRVPFRQVPDLVLRGLAELARAPAQ